MVDSLLQASKSDVRLAALLDEAREYAQVYLLARERKKGCEGTGELMTLREEFKDVIDKMISYCRRKDLLSSDCGYDPDLIADALIRIGRN